MSNIVQIRVCRREESVNRTRRVAVLKQQSPTDLERAVPDVLFLRQVFVELLCLPPVELDCLFRAVHPLEIGEKVLDVFPPHYNSLVRAIPSHKVFSLYMLPGQRHGFSLL